MGRVALVTGGGQGIGRAIALCLAAEGADVGVNDVRLETASRVAEEVRSLGRRAVPLIADVSIEEAVEGMFTEFFQTFDRLDILVNNVGITRRSRTEEHSLEDWEDVIGLNMTATFLMSKLAAQIMLKQGCGRIIHIGSLYSFTGGPKQIGYTASKGAVRQMAMAMSNEWAGRGINVNAIAPGYMATPLNAELRADPEWHGRVMDRLPMGRYGTPEDLKGIVIFLASAASDYISGVTIPVDGGFLGR